MADPLPVRCLWSSGFIANRGELLARTGAPPSVSDAGLLERLYRRHGPATPEQIAGPFAWVLWDGEARRLLAVRDRMGARGLYYEVKNGTVRIAPEVESLLPASPRVASLNLRSVAAQVHGEAPAEEETFYEGVHAVPPGGLLAVAEDRIEPRTYWRIEPRPVLRLPDDESYAAAFRDLLFEVVAGYVPAAPAGVTLSGGLDSTAVAAAVRGVSPATELVAFCWTAPELPAADEGRTAAGVARKLGCPTVALRADRYWPLSTEPGIRPAASGPLFNFFADLWDATFAAVRERGLRHLFTGVSGDHLFGGDVFSYPDLLLAGQWRKLAAEIRRHRPHSAIGLAGILRHMLAGPIARTALPLRRRMGEVPWLGGRLKGMVREQAPESPRRLLPGRRERLRVLRDPFLPAVALGMTEHASRQGIELRQPLLDHRLVEFAAALPTAQTFAAGRRKIVVRNAMRGLLPDEVLARWDKTYPTAIVERGLRERERGKVRELMTGMRAAELGFVDEGRLESAYEDYLAGRGDSALFWHTLCLEAWLRQHFTA